MLRCAAPILTLAKIAGTDCAVISHAISRRTENDWVTGTPGYTYRAKEKEEDPEAFGFTKLRAQKKYQEANEIIREAVQRIIKRFIMAAKQSMPLLKELGYEVKMAKPHSALDGGPDWVDWTWEVPVQVKDSLYGDAWHSYDLTLDMNGKLQVRARNWTTVWSDGPEGQLTFLHLIILFTGREHATTLAQFEQLIEGRRKRLMPRL